MKKILVILLFAIFLTACGLAWSNYAEKSFELGQEYTANVGDVMISLESGKINDVYKTKNGLRIDLVYIGKSANTAKIDYREYQVKPEGTLIREGFIQHLEYELDKDSTISYRSLKMKVIQATSNNIRFVVTDWGKQAEFEAYKKSN